MKNTLPVLIVVSLFAIPAFSQIKFCEETKIIIEYNAPVTVFKNALLIDGKGNAAKPYSWRSLNERLITNDDSYCLATGRRCRKIIQISILPLNVTVVCQ